MRERHKLTLNVVYESEPGWDAANELALKLGDLLMKQNGVLEVDGHVDPEVTENRTYVERLY